MANRVTYEWVQEHVDEDGDIQDLNHAEHLCDSFVNAAPVEGCTEVHIGLSKKIWNEVEGEIDRKYYYPKGEGESDFQPLPKHIEEARKFGLLA